MALVLADRVLETTTTAGSGTITLAGAEPGYQSFSAVGNGNQTYYTIANGAEWEVGIGTYTASGTTLSRDTVLSSSASGAKVTLSAGTKNVFVTYPSEKSVNFNVSGDITAATGRIINLGAPSLNSDAATKEYVDNMTTAALHVHEAVVLATPASSGRNDTYNGSTAYVMTRASDADTYGEQGAESLDEGSYFFVTGGTSLKGAAFVCNTAGTITFGTTPITFGEFSQAQVYSAGNGISLTATTISLASPVVVSNGGTGLTTTPTNGQLLIGNGTGYTLSTLTAGSGVSITNSAGSITLSATGAGGTVTAVTATGPLASSGGTTPDISIANTTGTGSVVLDQGATISSATITAALSASITTITGTSANITTVSGTTARFSSAAITQLSGTSAGITTVSGTTTTFSSGTITQFGATSATIASVSGTNATYSNGNFTSATVSTISGTTATYTSATVTNLNVTSVTLSNLSIASANITTLTGTTFGTTGATQLRGASATINNVYVPNALSVSATGARWDSNGDIYSYRSGGTTGVIFLSSSATRYLYWDGTTYSMPGGQLDVNGQRVLNAGNYNTYAVPAKTSSDWSNAPSVISNVVGLMAWKNYGNSHVIFDASASTSPAGGAVNNTNSSSPWIASYPTLMGWNGAGTYGVRVDSCRVADNGLPIVNVTSSTSIAATAGNHYILRGGATTVTLPASPAAGALVWVTVSNGRSDNVIARNGQNIQGLAENMTLDAAYAAVQLRFSDATMGWVFC